MKNKILIVLGLCAALLVVCEISASWMFAHLRSNLSVRGEIRTAEALRSTPGGPRPVLVVGNSLVLHGIDVAAVEQGLGPGYETTKVAIVDSGYEDWLYGVMSLLDRGSRPDAVVLGISPAQLVTDRPPTGTTARFLWTVPNLTRYAIDARPGLTAATDLLFEHVSQFFALRNQVRQDSRRLLVPGYVEMSRDFFVRAPIAPDVHVDAPIAEARLRALSAACAARGVRFVYLLIPTHAPDDADLEATLEDAGQRAGVPVLVPLSNHGLDPAWLLDGYHLNVAGASAFSARAGQALRALLAPGTMVGFGR